MTSDICEATAAGTEVTLRDTRDNKTYYVAKLKDSNCWMTQNLAYGTVDDTSIGTPCILNGTHYSGWANSNTEKYFAVRTHKDSDHTSQGNLYNWPAAVQGTEGGTNIQGVCPTGWQLPISNASATTDRSFNKLVTAYNAGNNAVGSAIMRGAPMYFQYSGSVSSGSLIGAGSDGYYWSSTPHGSNNAYSLYLAISYANPSSSGSSSIGRSVRCVAQ